MDILLHLKRSSTCLVWQIPYRRRTHLRMLLLEYRWFNRLISDPLWMKQHRSQIRKSVFGFFGFQIQRILFESGFGFARRNAKSKIRFWIRRKEHTLNLAWRNKSYELNFYLKLILEERCIIIFLSQSHHVVTFRATIALPLWFHFCGDTWERG